VVAAHLVYDGTGEPVIPAEMGTPAPGQFEGTPLEKLAEICCRVCYDSFGLDAVTGKPRGRSSAALHKHILDVGHGSVHEHVNITVEFDDVRNLMRVAPPGGNQDSSQLVLAGLVVGFGVLSNRKGVHVTPAAYDAGRVGFRVTFNPRVLTDWERHSSDFAQSHPAQSQFLFDSLRYHASQAVPAIITPPHSDVDLGAYSRTVPPETDDEIHISVYMRGSRGFGNEQVRHRFPVSQRSTRYVDESECEYIIHPLISKYISDSPGSCWPLIRAASEAETAAKRAYGLAVAELESYNLARGVGKLTARKQARGAARGYLGIATATEMVVTAPVSGWRWMARSRKSEAADAEIREVYTPVIAALRSSAHAARFADLETRPSPDGIGTVLK
jgi:thymidylate synthase ThyX